MEQLVTKDNKSQGPEKPSLASPKLVAKQEMPSGPNKPIEKEYDIFISYRADFNNIQKINFDLAKEYAKHLSLENLNDIKENIQLGYAENDYELKYWGCATARSLAQVLKDKGYTVFLDIDQNDFPEIYSALHAMRKAKLVFVIMSSSSLEGLNLQKGFARELEVAKEIYTQNPGKIKFLNLNESFNQNKISDPNFRWLSSVHYIPFKTNRDFKYTLDGILGSIPPTIRSGFSKIERIQNLHQRIRKLHKHIGALYLSIALIVLAFFVFWTIQTNKQTNETTILFVGGGTAKNYLKTEEVYVEQYDEPAKYIHMPSFGAIVLLSEVAKDTNQDLLPIAISAGRYDSKTINDIIDSKRFSMTHRILEYKCKKAASVDVLLYPSDSFPSLKGAIIDIPTLVQLISDTNTTLLTTNLISGTYQYYSRTIPHFDSIVASKKADSLKSEFFPKGTPYHLDDFTEKGDKIIVLQNEYYNILDEAMIVSSDREKSKILHLANNGAVDSIPIYVYTVIKKQGSQPILKKDSPQYRFLAKIGYHISDTSKTEETFKEKSPFLINLNDTP